VAWAEVYLSTQGCARNVSGRDQDETFAGLERVRRDRDVEMHVDINAVNLT